MHEYDAAPRLYCRHHCYDKEVVSVGTHLNFYYIHDSLILSFFFNVTYCRRYTSPTHVHQYVCLCAIFLTIKLLELRNATQILQI
jgi:hypothetical protein